MVIFACPEEAVVGTSHPCSGRVGRSLDTRSGLSRGTVYLYAVLAGNLNVRTTDH